MPIYHVAIPAGALDSSAKARIAQAVTDVHCTVTGAKPELVNVFVQEFADDSAYVGGQPSRHYLVHGLIRAGRSLDDQQTMLRDISRRVASIASVTEDRVGVAIEDIDAAHAIEGGKILPAPQARS